MSATLDRGSRSAPGPQVDLDTGRADHALAEVDGVDAGDAPTAVIDAHRSAATGADRRQLLDDHAARAAARPPGTLEATILRTGDRAGLDVLAHLASRGAATLTQVEEAVRAGRLDPARIGVTDLDPRWLPALARTCALHPAVDVATTALALARAVAGLPASWEHLTADQADVCTQVLFRHADKPEEVERALQRWPVRPTVADALEADARNPLTATPRSLRLSASTDVAALDRLSIVVPDRDQITDGPLVSVIVPVLRPTGALTTSVRSLRPRPDGPSRCWSSTTAPVRPPMPTSPSSSRSTLGSGSCGWPTTAAPTPPVTPA